MSDNLNTVPPHSLEAEKSTLGALLIDQDAIIKIADVISAEDFYSPANALIFNAIMELYNKRIPIDILTVTALLEDNNKLELTGGTSYLVSLTNEVPTATHVYQYAIIVKHKATLRKLLKAGHQITALGFEESKDIEELLEDAEKSLFSVSQTFVKDKFIHIKEVLSSTYEKIADLHDPDSKDKYAGIPSGFEDLDAITSGLHPSDLVILAARPAMGKTAFALNIAQNVAKKNKAVGVISLEMSKEQLVERLFCSLLEVDSWKIKAGKLSEEDFAKIGPVMDELNSLKIYIDDSLGNSIVELRAKTRRLQMEHGLDVLIIDYLQLMTAGKPGTGFGNRVQEISEISRSLKSLARELHIPIIALSQLSRAVELRPSKEPQLSDLRESGAIEQDADIVMMLYREDYYDPDTDKKGITDLFIRKHRNGPVGHVELQFQKERMRFYDIEKKRSDTEMSGPAIAANYNAHSFKNNQVGYQQSSNSGYQNNNGYNNSGGYQNQNNGGYNNGGGYQKPNNYGSNNYQQKNQSPPPAAPPGGSKPFMPDF
jgi:replicative DNA helicase